MSFAPASSPLDSQPDDCVRYPCPPAIPIADWPDGGGVLAIPGELQDFDAGAWCVGHEHGPGAEAIAEHVWLQWCAAVGSSLVCAYYHEPLGFFVALVRAADGRILRGLKVQPPRGVQWDDRMERSRTWARDTAIAAAAALRSATRGATDASATSTASGEAAPGQVDEAARGEADEAWLRRQLDRLGRRDA